MNVNGMYINNFREIECSSCGNVGSMDGLNRFQSYPFCGLKCGVCGKIIHLYLDETGLGIQ